MNLTHKLKQAKNIIEEADAIFITAGAGMGVDSGLPDFRGTEGFWRAYPKVKKLGLSFEEMANPEWFDKDPSLAWAFYGHRMHLYRDTIPHGGFEKLLKFAHTKKYGTFVFTSNVDGQFQKAGFEDNQVMECHGSIHHLQCIQDCEGEIWSASQINIDTDKSFNALDPLPHCHNCEAIARPNILMFGDYGWNYQRTNSQRDRLTTWLSMLQQNSAKLAIIELGAGTAVPTVRNSSQRIANEFNTPLIRINPRESQDAPLGIPMGATEALSYIL